MPPQPPPLYLSEIMALPDQTDVVGDLDLLEQYIASGQAAGDYDRLLAEQRAHYVRLNQPSALPCDASEE